MRQWLRHLDDLLRGRRTEPELLANDRMDLPMGKFLVLVILLGAIYGFFMGWFGLINCSPANPVQILASMIKVPALFLLTLLVTFPSLYVFNALVGCRLSLVATLKLLVASIAVNLAIAASFGTILGFFTLSTTSYSFMVLLNVVLLGIAGMVGLGFLLRVLHKLALWQSAIDYPIEEIDLANSPSGVQPEVDSPAHRLALPAARKVDGDAMGPANAVFRVWVIIYALVGAQMGWLLRPFIGSPAMPFRWFRVRSGNFFQAVFESVQKLIEGGG